jgi:hypothetical protein
MGWGHILLYPDRLTGILEAGPQKQRMDDAGDSVLALMGVGETGRQIGAGLAGRINLPQRIVDYFGPWIADGGPFAAAAASLEGSFDTLDSTLGNLLKTLAETPASQWRAPILAKLDVSLDLLAPIDARKLVLFLRAELEGVIDQLKRPVRDGPRSIEAHRALRAAVALRRVLRPAFARLDDAEDALGAFNLKARLRLAIRGLLEGMQGPDFERLQAFFQTLDASLGVMLRAGSGFRVDVTVTVDGPEFAASADPPPFFEPQAVPHEKPGAVWVTDLVTNIMASLSLFWEVIRTAAFHQRPVDGIMMLLGLVWQVSRTVVRAAWPEKINLAVADFSPPALDPGTWFKNWMFTDQGDFALNAVWRIFGSLHEHHAPSNWYLSVFRRLLGHVSHVSNWRIPYQFARSIWYMMGLRHIMVRPDVAPSRLLMLAIGPAWFTAIICSLACPWEDFELEQMSGALIACLIIPVVVFLFCLFFFPKFFLDDFFPQVALDRATALVLGIGAIFGCIVTALLIGELEMDSAGLQTALGAILWVVLGLSAVMTTLTMFDVAGLQQVFHGQAALLGLLMAALLFFLWYFYLDDGRDKPGVYKPLDADRSPFRLPYPEGDNWLCGQGSHGIFSHVRSSPSNHYSYDFNHEPRADGLVSRDGIVFQLREDRQDDLDRPNTVAILHTSWSDAVDPGSDSERILTYTEFVHISQGSVRVAQFDRVRQGDHLVQIDNNGRSAQHHLHFGSNAQQGNGGLVDINVPVVFADSSTHWFRNYPFLARFPGKGHIPGKPLSMAFYVSGNPKRAVGVNPRVLRLADATLAGAAVPHGHDLLIDATILGSDTLPATATLRTSIDHGHSHEITLTQAQLQALMEWQDVAAVSADTLGHTHVLAPLPHRRVNTLGGGSARAITVAQPPGAFLTAETPLPYALAGARFVLRVDDGLTEFHDLMADPARFLSDIAVDLGLAPGETLAVGTVSAALDHGAGRLGVRGTAATASRIWRGATVPIAEARPVAIPVPVLVIETRHGGSSATLAFDAASSLPLAGPPPAAASGSGAVPDGRTVSRDDLATLLAAGLTAGQPVAPGITLGKASIATQLDVSSGGAAVAFTGGSSRLDSVLSRLYIPAQLRLPSNGTLPLGPGRFGLNGVSVPILARSAHHRIPIAGDPFTGATRNETPLAVILRGARQELFLPPGATTADAIARAVNSSIEGVRAFADGADLIIETIDGGPDARLQVDKAAPGGTPLALPVAAGTSPAGNGMTSASAMPLSVLARQIEEAQAAAVLPYDPAVIAPSATVNGERIELTVATGHTIAVEAVEFSGPSAVLAFEPTVGAPSTSVRTVALPANIPLIGAGWVDVRIDGTHRVRIALDAERARLELPPLSRLPAANEQLRVSVDGGAAVAITFTGAEPGLADVAAAIAAELPDCLVRVAYRTQLTDAYRGDVSAATVTLGAAANGLRQMGFLGDLATPVPRLGLFADSSPARDGLAALPRGGAAGDGWSMEAPFRATGNINTGLLTITDGGSGNPMTLTAAAGHRVSVALENGGDPFALNAAGTAASIATPAFADSLPWGRTGLRQQIRVEQTASGRLASTRLSLQALPAILHAVRAPAPLAPKPRTLSLTVTPPGGTARTHSVDLDGIALADLDLVAGAISRTVPGVRAWAYLADLGPLGLPAENRLHIETEGAGTGWRLAAAPLDLAGLLGLASETAAGTALEASGGGDVADASFVTRAELLAALNRAAALLTQAPDVAPPPAGTPGNAFDQTAISAGSAYGARRPDDRFDRFLRYESATLGSRSAIACIEQAGRGLRFPTGQIRSPALRGCVIIPPLAGDLALNGQLHIEFNEPPPGSAILAPTLVIVPFPASTYSAAQITAAIHSAAVAANAGTATLYADGSIVVETREPGLLGSVRLPAAGTPRTVADPLLGAGATMFGRGWPDSGRLGHRNALRTGFRSRDGAATADAQWLFTDGTTNVQIAVSIGDTAEELADRLNQQFATSATPVGVAASVSGVLFVEGRTDVFGLLVDGIQLGANLGDRDRNWLTPERISEPAFDLRRTNEVRTVRLARGRVPVFDPANADDWGWLRLPFDSSVAAPVPAAVPPPVLPVLGNVGTFRALPPGRYAVDLRSDAAKATNYDLPAARIISAPGGSNLVHAVRYGILVAGRSAWALHRLADGEVGEEWSF